MLKIAFSPIWKLVGVALIVSASGCAVAYHDYQGCCIPYLYCTPPPLPHVHYDGCHCPTPGASLYFQQRRSSGSVIAESDAPIDVPTPSGQNGAGGHELE